MCDAATGYCVLCWSLGLKNPSGYRRCWSQDAQPYRGWGIRVWFVVVVVTSDRLALVWRTENSLCYTPHSSS